MVTLTVHRGRAAPVPSLTFGCEAVTIFVGTWSERMMGHLLGSTIMAAMVSTITLRRMPLQQGGHGRTILQRKTERRSESYNDRGSSYLFVT